MARLSLILSVMGFSSTIANTYAFRNDCGTCEVPKRDVINFMGKKRHCESSSNEMDSSSRSDCGISDSSSDRSNRRNRCADSSNSDSGYSGDCSESYSSCMSSSSSSSCASNSEQYKGKCATELEIPLEKMKNTLFTYLIGFEKQYKESVVAFLQGQISQASVISSAYVSTQYTALLAALADLGFVIPADVVTQLKAWDTAEASALARSIQETAVKVLKDLLCRVNKMCHSDLMGLIDSGLFSSQVLSAFSNMQPLINSYADELFAKQMAVFESLNIEFTSQAIDAIVIGLHLNGTDFIAFFTAQVCAQQVSAQADLAQLYLYLDIMITASSTDFQAIALFEIQSIMNKVFGTAIVPPASTNTPVTTPPATTTPPTQPTQPEQPTQPVSPLPGSV
ncbi:spore wall protein Swp1b [Ordospora colligata]|nr:spore wall protein Swp1b [Ordospora colligata]